MLTVNHANFSNVQSQKIFTNLDSSWSGFFYEITQNVDYSMHELCQFVSNTENYNMAKTRFSQVIHHNLSSNQYSEFESNKVLQDFTLFIFSAQCVVVDLISEKCHEHTIFHRFYSRFGLPLITIINAFHLSEEVLIDLLVITANRAFENNLQNNVNSNFWQQVVPSKSLSYSSIEQISKCQAIDFSEQDFSSEVSWMGALELFHNDQEIVRLEVGKTNLPYFMRLDVLISIYNGLSGLNLVCSVLDIKTNTDKIYINYRAFRDSVARYCLNLKIINSDPYGSLQGIMDSCDDVEFTEEGYRVIHEDKIRVFKRADLVCDISREVGNERYGVFITYIESILLFDEEKKNHYINLDRLNQIFDMMPILD